MDSTQLKSFGVSFLKKWAWSILLVPFVGYSLHQAWWTLHYNIFFSINYDFPFPINIINIFVSNFLLIIHEAGHTFFSILGWRTLTILGGSLLEVMMPIIILIYFCFNRIKSGIQLSLYLVGFSLISVAFYVADASSRQLPLIGNLPKSHHDWYNLLRRWNLLESDDFIAAILTIMAALLYLAAILYPLFHTEYRQVHLDIEL